MATRKILIVLSSLLISVAAIYGISAFTPLNLTGFILGNGNDFLSSTEKLYELVNPGVDVSVVKYDEVSGMYKVLFKAVDASGTTTYREVYVTKDGEIMTESVVFISQSIDRITAMHKFVDCLDSKGVRIFGVSNQTATILQLNALGGSYATKLYVSCDNDATGECTKMVENGVIDQVPSVVYNNQGFSGVQSISFFQGLTGCIV